MSGWRASERERGWVWNGKTLYELMLAFCRYPREQRRIFAMTKYNRVSTSSNLQPPQCVFKCGLQNPTSPHTVPIHQPHATPHLAADVEKRAARERLGAGAFGRFLESSRFTYKVLKQAFSPWMCESLISYSQRENCHIVVNNSMQRAGGVCYGRFWVRDWLCKYCRRSAQGTEGFGIAAHCFRHELALR